MLLDNELNNHKLCTYYIYIFYFTVLYFIKYRRIATKVLFVL